MAAVPGEVLRRPKRWVVAEPPPETLQQALADVHPLLLRLLYNRGLRDPEEFRRYHDTSLDDLHDPFLMPHMAAAVSRLQRAAKLDELVVIYGDFDADGVTGSAILQKAFASAGIRTRSYIPKRLDEGYGLHSSAIDVLATQEARVIVTVDCGITSVDEVERARQHGIDVIICDHHKLADELPDALAILHPGLGAYPFPHLCAAGVSFKLAQALWDRAESRVPSAEMRSGDPAELIDFAAVGTLADMVPLKGENRVLVRHGLQKMNASPSSGLRAMLELAGIEIGQVSCGDVSFVLAPHINASGRLDDAGIALQLLVTPDEAHAAELAERLRSLNQERQRLTQEVLAAAREQVAAADADAMAYVVGGEGWPPGVVGLVASKLTEELGRPVFAMELGEEVCRGSARSIPGFDLVEALGACRELLTRYGGHPRAAGFTLRRGAFQEFARAIAGRASATLSAQDVEPTVFIDTELKPRHLNWDIYRIVQQVAPFGVGNPAPTFLIRNLRALKPRVTANNHLRMAFTDGRQTIDAFAYGLGDSAQWINENPAIDVVFEFNANKLQGYETLELRVRDLRGRRDD